MAKRLAKNTKIPIIPRHAGDNTRQLITVTEVADPASGLNFQKDNDAEAEDSKTLSW